MPEEVAKKKRVRKVKSTTTIRFDAELNEQQTAALDVLLQTCFRNRKNFAEALILMSVKAQAEGKTTIDLTRLGVVTTPIVSESPKPKEVVTSSEVLGVTKMAEEASI